MLLQSDVRKQLIHKQSHNAFPLDTLDVGGGQTLQANAAKGSRRHVGPKRKPTHPRNNRHPHQLVKLPGPPHPPRSLLEQPL